MLTYADVCSTLRELLTPKDYLALDIGKSVSKSTSRLACFTRELEKVDDAQKRLVDSILGTQFACFTGTLADARGMLASVAHTPRWQEQVLDLLLLYLIYLLC
jgi:hypothetical protein